MEHQKIMDTLETYQLLTHRAGGKHGDEEDLRWRFPSPTGCREELLDPPDLRVNGGGGSRYVLEK
jgi:hypothetical protein